MKKLSYMYIFAFVLMVFSTEIISAEPQNENEVTYEIAEDDILFGMLQGLFGQAANIIVGGELPDKPDHIITILSEALNKSLTSLILALIVFRFSRWVVATKSQGGTDVFDFQHAPLPILFAIIAIIPVKGGLSFLQMVTLQVAGYSIKISNYETNVAANFLEKYGSYSTLSHLANVEENAIATVVGSICKGIINKQDRYGNIQQTSSSSLFEHEVNGPRKIGGYYPNGRPMYFSETIGKVTYVNFTKYSRSGVFQDNQAAEEHNAANGLTPSKGRVAKSYKDDVCGNSQLIFPELKEDDHFMMIGEFRNSIATHYSILNNQLASISADIVNNTYNASGGKYSHMNDEFIERIKRAVSTFKVAYQQELATLVSIYSPSQSSESSGLNNSSAADVLRKKGTAYLGVFYLEFMKKNSKTLEATKLKFTQKMPNSEKWDYFFTNTSTKTPDGIVKIIKSLKANINANLPENENKINKQIREGHEQIDKIIAGESDDMWQYPTELVVGTTSFIMKNLIDETDPIGGLVNTGHYIIASMESYYLITQLAKIKIKIAHRIAEAGKEVSAGVADGLPVVGSSAKGVIEGAWIGINFGFTFIQDSLDLAQYLILPALLAGIFLAFWLPSIPMIHWINTMIGFLIVVFNTFVLAPALAIAHLITTDNKMLGQKTNHGYMAILQLLLYLPLVVISFFGSVMILMAGTKLIQVIFIPMMLSIIGNSMAGLVTLFFFMFLFIGLNIQMFNRCFALLSSTPEKLNEYIGGGAEMLDDKEGVSGTKAIVTNIDSAAKESVSTNRMQNKPRDSPDKNTKANFNKDVT
jgi:conjugal transfer/type IV secretion protein DotA/TraY